MSIRKRIGAYLATLLLITGGLIGFTAAPAMATCYFISQPNLYGFNGNACTLSSIWLYGPGATPPGNNTSGLCRDIPTPYDNWINSIIMPQVGGPAVTIFAYDGDNCSGTEWSWSTPAWGNLPGAQQNRWESFRIYCTSINCDPYPW